MLSIINVTNADVDVGDVTTRVLLMDSDLKPVYAVLFSCKYSMICDNSSETRHFSEVVFLVLGCRN